ncbi:MAG: hypothetical protein K5746_02570 [Clostridiales bacterium]|nr:hypothetical protein [Clostridiales bacterium]
MSEILSGPVFRLTVYGARGSMAISGNEYRLFGGRTSCYLVQAGIASIFLDAGSGMLSAPVDFPEPPLVLLSHLHIDHLLGLGMYPRLSWKGQRTGIYVPVQDPAEAERALCGLYSPPYWPLSLAGYAGDVQIHPLLFPLQAGEAIIDGVEGNHPGGCVAMRIRFRGKTLIYLTDYEYSSSSFPRLSAFSEGADLILCDGQYTQEQYETRKGFGHSTEEVGIALLETSRAKRLLLIHHDPHSTDSELLDRERQIGRENVHFAREGEVIDL